MQKAIKVYGFGTSFYSELQDSQKSQGRYFTYVIIFLGAVAFFALGLLPDSFSKDILRITSLQLRILGTSAILSIIILFRFLYEKYVIQRNLVIDIEEGDDNWLPIQAKVADFWFVQSLHLRGISYEAHIVIQFPYKKRPLRIKVICPIVTMPEYIKELAIHDPIMDNIQSLTTRSTHNTMSDDQKKHELHKRMPHILMIQESVTVYMDQRNQYNPYANISMHSLFSTPYSAGYIMLLDKIKKILLFIVNCIAIFYICYAFISILLGLALILHRLAT